MLDEALKQNDELHCREIESETNPLQPYNPMTRGSDGDVGS